VAMVMGLSFTNRAMTMTMMHPIQAHMYIEASDGTNDMAVPSTGDEVKNRLRLSAVAKDTYGHGASGGRCGGKPATVSPAKSFSVSKVVAPSMPSSAHEAASAFRCGLRNCVIDPSRASSGEGEVHVGLGHLLYEVAGRHHHAHRPSS
jgi:hypothetical protein